MDSRFNLNFMKYANETHSNIIPKEEFEDLVQQTFSIISENLCKSLGPLGSSATILNGMMTEATKDGYSILKNYRFRNDYMKMIYNLILAPCTKMNNTVGDGTTTAIALSNAMFNQYKTQKDVFESLYRLPRQFVKVWDDIIEELCQRIQKKATPINPEDYDTIYNIAYVTSNGNIEVSTEMAKTYQSAKSPSIKRKDSPTNKSYIAPISGFEFPANLLDTLFAKNQDGTAVEENIYVMLFDHKIETDTLNNILIPINRVMRSMGKKLLVLAPHYDEYMMSTVLEQFLHIELQQFGSLNMIMAQFQLGKLESHQMTDLATVLRGKHIPENMEKVLKDAIAEEGIDKVMDAIFEDPQHSCYHLIGECAEALLSTQTGSIFKVKDIEKDEKYQRVLAEARSDLDNIINSTDAERQAFSHKIYKAKARVNQLEMKNFIYYVGADSKLQKQILEDSIDDVIKCVRSAIKSGVVPGCQLTIINSCTDMIKETLGDNADNEDIDPANITDEDKLKVQILAMISASVMDVYSRVLHGADGKGMIKLLPRWAETTEDGLTKLQEEAIQKGVDIITESINQNKVFDMETLKYNENIITSAETDIMVLKAASELVKILISGNQCIIVDASKDNEHEETIEAYV